MKILLNGQSHEVNNARLSDLIDELGYADACIGVALNGEFVPKAEHHATCISNGDELEVLAPLQGG